MGDNTKVLKKIKIQTLLSSVVFNNKKQVKQIAISKSR